MKRKKRRKEKKNKVEDSINLEKEEKNILKEFPELFDDNLNGKRVIKVPPVKININKDYQGAVHRKSVV